MDGLVSHNSISASTLYAVIWMEFGLSTVVMVLRGYSQLFIVRKPSADDYVMFAAWIFQGVASILCSIATSWGLGANLFTLTEEGIVNVLKFTMISMPFGVLGPLMGRISFILFLLISVITVYKVRRKLLWGMIGAQVVINVIPIILQFTQCHSVQDLWNPYKVAESCRGGLVVQRYGYFQGAFNALTDLVLIGMGLTVIISLKLQLHNKIILCVVLSLSTLAMIAAILKTIQLQTMAGFDFSYAYGMWTIWFLTEGAVVIVTASIPRLRAMILVLRRNNGKSSYNQSGSNRQHIYHDNRAYMKKPSRVTYEETSLEDLPIFPEAARTNWSSRQDSGYDMPFDQRISPNASLKEASNV